MRRDVTLRYDDGVARGYAMVLDVSPRNVTRWPLFCWGGHSVRRSATLAQQDAYDNR